MSLLHGVCRLSTVRLQVFLQCGRGGEGFLALPAEQLWGLETRMAAFVSRQLGGALELQLAGVAGIRPLPRVDSPVKLSLADGEEGLLAVPAGERALSRVDEVVSSQCVRFGEALPAVGARVRACARVGEDVLLLGFLALESFVALSAGVRPVVHMRPVMLGQLSLRQKAFATLRTEERLFPRVHPFVSGQHGCEGESLRTVGALERSLACVNPEVLREHKAEREAPAALVTLKRALTAVSGQVSLHVRPPGVNLVTVWAFKLTLESVQLPVLRAGQQGVKAFVTLLTDVTFGGNVGFPVLQELRGSGETLAADGAHPRELTLLRVGLFVMDGQSSQVGKGTPAELAGE